jgi:hypothetical protein
LGKPSAYSGSAQGKNSELTNSSHSKPSGLSGSSGSRLSATLIRHRATASSPRLSYMLATVPMSSEFRTSDYRGSIGKVAPPKL